METGVNNGLLFIPALLNNVVFLHGHNPYRNAALQVVIALLSSAEQCNLTLTHRATLSPLDSSLCLFLIGFVLNVPKALRGAKASAGLPTL